MDRNPDRSRCVVLRRIALAVSLALASFAIQSDGFASEPGPFLSPAGAAPVGSGDGRIHVIPSISRPSLKNGEKVAIGAVVSALAGVAGVEAEVVPFAGAESGLDKTPIARLQLAPAVPAAGAQALGKNETAALWQADWIGAGLAEGYYQVRIAATDRAGHHFVDRSLRFSDPIAGINAPGTNAYPHGGLRQVEDTIDGEFLCAVYDPASNCAYFGTDSVPGAIVKVAMGSGAAPPRRIGTLILNHGEDKLYAAVADSAHGYAYFVSYSGREIIKIALKPGDALPVRIGAVTLPASEHLLSAAVIDTAHGYAYIGASDQSVIPLPGNIVKVALGTGDAPPRRVSSLGLEEPENLVLSAVIDPAAGYAYFEASSYVKAGNEVHFLKVALGSGDTSPTRIGVLKFDVGMRSGAAVIDPASHYAYMTCRSPAHSLATAIAKIALGSGNALPTLVNYLEVPFADGAAVVNLSTHEALFSGTTGLIHKIRLGTGSAAPTLIGTLSPSQAEFPLQCAVLNPSTGKALFGSYTSPARLVDIQMGSAGANPSRLGSVQLSAACAPNLGSFVDQSRGFIYFLANGASHSVIHNSSAPLLSKYALASGRTPARWVGEANIPNIGIPGPIVPDLAAGYAYLILNAFNILSPAPARMYKIALGGADAPPRIVSSMDFLPSELRICSGAIDSASGYAYFNCWGSDSQSVVKVALGSGDTSPTRIASCLAHLDSTTSIAAIDPSAGFLYLTDQYCYLDKVALGIGNAPPAEIGFIKGHAFDVFARRAAAVIDPLSGYAWVAAMSAPGMTIHKIALGAGQALPHEVSHFVLGPGVLDLDLDSHQNYRGTNQPPSLIDREAGFAILAGKVKIALGDGDSTPSLIGAFGSSVPDSDYEDFHAAYDPSSGFEYLAAGRLNGPSNDQAGAGMLRYAYSQKGLIKSTRFNLPERSEIQSFSFYSHRAAGNVRLALYREDSASLRTLVWESNSIPNAAANSFIQIPVSAGSPATLKLDPGTYHLAWQIDTTADVPSLTPGAQGDGSYVLQNFGPFPAQMKTDDATTSWTSTNEKWTGFITYQGISGVPRELWVGY